MKRSFSLLLALTLVAVWVLPVLAAPSAYSNYPYFFIASVTKNSKVTITAYNFPPNDLFKVRMGTYGTAGIAGYVVDTVTTGGAGGLSNITFNVPASLAGAYRIAIRLESSASGYYAYNWFYNDTTGSSSPVVTPPGYSGYPYFFIASVAKDDTVTITPYNFPPNDTFKVRLGAYGTLGLGGDVVKTVTTDASGKLSNLTYDIPASVAGAYRIAIRLESPTSGYYGYNWFYNNTASSGTVVVPPVPGYVGYPYFFIASVAKDSKVSLNAYNFPPNSTFNVRMGAYGSYGIGGYLVDTVTSNNAGVLSKTTFDIPAALAGSARIAIRFDSANGIYFAYNWFYNNTAP